MDYSQRIKELRIENDFTQKELAAQLGLSPNIVCEWEKGRCSPSIEALKNMAKIFECTTDYLLGLEDDFGNVTVYKADSLSEEEQKIIDVLRKSAPIYPVDFVMLYAELPTYMQEALFAELKGMNLGYKASKKKIN